LGQGLGGRLFVFELVLDGGHGQMVGEKEFHAAKQTLQMLIGRITPGQLRKNVLLQALLASIVENRKLSQQIAYKKQHRQPGRIIAAAEFVKLAAQLADVARRFLTAHHHQILALPETCRSKPPSRPTVQLMP